jgi:hypothetical protein
LAKFNALVSRCPEHEKPGFILRNESAETAFSRSLSASDKYSNHRDKRDTPKDGYPDSERGIKKAGNADGYEKPRITAKEQQSPSQNTSHDRKFNCVPRHSASMFNRLPAMKTRIWATVIGVGVVIALFVSPGLAIAKSGSFVIGPSQTMEFGLKGSHGYSISVSGSGGKISLTARHGGSSASYLTPGVASSTRIKARFGHLGRVSVQFHSDSGPRRMPLPKGNCRGKGEIVDRGHWVGTIEFKGEQEYSAVHASRVRGKVTKFLKKTCSRTQEEGSARNIRVTSLSAVSKTGGVFLVAFKVTSNSYPAVNGSAFTASILEQLGRRLFVTRSIEASAAVDAFTSTEADGRIESVTIAPPAPFTGTAAFQRTAGSKGSWLGSLVGDFLGRGEVALAGPEFSAEIHG